MKKVFLPVTCFMFAAGLTACNNDSNVNKTTDKKDNTGNAITNQTNAGNHTTVPSAPNNSKLPMSPDDSAFIMTAALGSIKEVETGKVAQQNAQSERVKEYGSMMVKDHSGANQELMTLAGRGGLMLPTTLPQEHKKHVDAMRTMKGRSFDSHYMKMMVDDHQKTVAEFQKQANGGSNAEIKAFAAKMLPVLQMHRDSAVAINNSIK